MHHFSKRTAWEISEFPYAEAIRFVRGSREPLFDLTWSNPTACGLSYDAEAILQPLRQAEALHYHPDPRGLVSARESVAAYYFEKGIKVDPGAVQLTTSTSESYSYLFRLLCDPGDEVLVPQPSYPLFDFLAALDDVRLAPYPLFHDFGWHIDVAALEARISSRTRAILLVHPNNPTGHYTAAAERTQLEAICWRHGLALIVDEVFLDYPLQGHGESFAARDHPVLTFVLSGLSKVAALPQMKVGWIVTRGPEPDLQTALDRLEIIADTFLSVSVPAQLALPAWLRGSPVIQARIRERIQANLASAKAILTRQTAVTLLEVHAGWTVVLRIPAIEPDQDFAIRLARERRTLIHPGSFYGFPPRGRIVLSLLTAGAEFEEGLERLIGMNQGS